MAKENKPFDDFFHRLIPNPLRNKLDPYSAAYIRARALSALLVIISGLGISTCALVALLDFMGLPSLRVYLLVISVITALVVLQAVLFYRFQNPWASGMGFNIFYFLAATVMLVLSGGYDSPGKVFLITCPMIAFLLGGWQEGIQSAFLTMLFGLALVTFKYIGFDTPNLFFNENPHVIFIVDWVITIIITIACFTIYEAGLEHTHQAPDSYVQDARNRLIRFDNAMENFFHKLVPTDLRQLDINSRLYARARVLSLMLCAATLMSGVSMVVLIASHFFLSPALLRYDTNIVVITLLFALQTWLFYRYKNPVLSGMLLGYFCFLLIVALVMIGGGYDSPLLILLAICPLVFFMVNGLREGIQNGIFVALIGVVFGFLARENFVFTNVFVDAPPLLTFSIAWVLTITGICLCLMVYDAQLDKGR